MGTSASPRPDVEPGPLRAAAGLMLGPAVALGLGRFAYALVLPDMRADLSWSFATAGTMNTANALGYLVGALVAARSARRFGERRMFLLSLLVTALLLAASALTGASAAVFLLRLGAGAAGAVSFVVGGGLVARAGRDSTDRTATLALGVYFAGGGAGILLSGLVVPVVLHAGGWRAAWAVIGALSALAVLAVVPVVRRLRQSAPGGRDLAAAPAELRPLIALATCYGLFGAGYIAYMTFIIALLESSGAEPGQVTAFWVLLGGAAAGAGFAWNTVLARLRPGYGTALVLAVLTTGAAIPVVWTGTAGFAVSAVLFGGSFLTVVTAVTGSVRRVLPTDRWTGAIGALTVVFALGQCAGPLLSGALSDGHGGVSAGLTIGAALLAIASVLAFVQGLRRTAD
ncbi:YbfB/YjiJ family MFS transporter [Amycolatopsis antarctica]|nr:YbfB/YjiJ family MFS transporter [Amycolatopsis antarctica]